MHACMCSSHCMCVNVHECADTEIDIYRHTFLLYDRVGHLTKHYTHVYTYSSDLVHDILVCMCVITLVMSSSRKYSLHHSPEGKQKMHIEARTSSRCHAKAAQHAAISLDSTHRRIPCKCSIELQPCYLFLSASANCAGAHLNFTSYLDVNLSEIHATGRLALRPIDVPTRLVVLADFGEAVCAFAAAAEPEPAEPPDHVILIKCGI
jgi:hypothetical protein